MLGKVIYIFILKKDNILLPLSSYASSEMNKTLIFLQLRCAGPSFSANQGTAPAAQSRAESQSLEQGARGLLSNACQRQPREAARGGEFSK